MASSFNVNKSDLDFILQQIQISEMHSGGMDLVDAISQFYAINPADASILPAGLRTVSGEFNNLIVGREDFGAADNLFPRLLDPVYKDEQDGEVFGNPAMPIATNTNYGAAGNVVDSDPRTISNLVVDQTVANPAAIYAALAVAGVTGQEATNAVNLILDAYRNTQNAGQADAAVTAAQAVQSAAAVVLADATTDNAAALAELGAFTAGNGLAPAAVAATAPIAADMSALAGALNTLGTADAANSAAQAALIPLEDAVTAAADLLMAAQDILNGLTMADPGYAGALAERDMRQADFDAADALAAPARATATSAASDLVDAQAGAASAYTTAETSANAALDAADAVVSALGTSATSEAGTAASEAQALVDALAAVNIDGLSGSDEAAVTAAAAAFDPTAAQTSADSFAMLISDATAAQAVTQSTLTDATVAFNTADAALTAAMDAAGTAGTPEETAEALADAIDAFGLEVGPDGAVFIQNLSPDIGLSPSFNSFMTIFGQFFDHGLDLVTKGGNGTVFIPLKDDDPLVAGADGVFGNEDDLPLHQRFMALTRATPTTDENGDQQHENTTTPFVDQNQTYTSHASHQVFLRDYMRLDLGGGVETYATGRLLDGQTANGSLDGAIGNWAEVKTNALVNLGIRLDDFDIHNVPLLATDPYGNLIKGPNGYAQMVMEPLTEGGDFWLQEGTLAGITTDGAAFTNHKFLDDIAHAAVPNEGQTADLDDVAGGNHDPNTYDDELLDAHYISGDGRGNENIALTMIHGLFHSEHNRQAETNKQTILDSGDIDFINEWLLVDLLPGATIPGTPDGLVWDGDRLFQSARFSTEMQYQHMVVEEFARTITPGMEAFPGNNDVTVDPDIIAEFAHAVYRFGHSMLNSTVDRFDNDLNAVGGATDEQISLIDAFLNPVEFLDSGPDFKSAQAALVRGITQDVGNEIDEFVVDALRSNLLGLPLDLAALNIARGRETGTATLQEARAQLSNDFGLVDLNPYSGWGDFSANIKTPLSVINFIAAYGTHDAITSATTLEEKRDAATLLVLGDGDLSDGVDINGVNVTAQDRADFLAGNGVYASDNGGLDAVDLWIGGLAEAKNEFGGFLGTTFNFLFEYQMEQLQSGDRLYYLHRTGGMNLLDQLEANSFADIVRRNTELGDEHATHLYASLFSTPDAIFEMDKSIAQADYNGDGAGLDMQWDDPQLELLNPKTVRIDGTLGADGHYYGGEFHFNGGEHVAIGGTEGNDIITSGLGDDAIWGDGGDDYINGGAAADDVHGGTGDDIIVDPFGENVLRGEQGNDVISVARGLNLIFGGLGTDAVLLGQDGSEAFLGEGDDFAMGGTGDDFLGGGEGNDWLEGGDGADGFEGDHSPILPNPNVGGDDVLWGQGNDSRYELEGGDDIAFDGGGVDRFEGLSGFDWAIAKYGASGATLDLDIGLFTNLPNQILADRFDQMEGLSGWDFDDTLSGDNAGQAIGGVIDPLVFDNHVLDAEGIAKIEGLQEWFDGALETLGGAGATSFRDGNILLGGDGSDVIMGRGGNDIIDGDAWLNVRIRIVVDGVEYSAESMNSSTAAAGPFAGKVYATDVNGDPDFMQEAFDGRSLSSLLLDRTINPGEMSIVREIKYDENPSDDLDTAVFQGTLAEYDIEGRGEVVDGVTLNSMDMNGDGFISITDRDDGVTGATVDGVVLASRGALIDNTDLLKNIELVQFAGQTISLTGGVVLNQPPVAVDDDYLTQSDEAINVVATIGVLNNDTDSDGNPLVAEVLAGPANGSVMMTADGSFVYDPNAGFFGEDTFTYTVSDGQGGSDVGTVTVTVNAPPVANNDGSYGVTVGGSLSIGAAGGVLANDTDADGDDLAVTTVVSDVADGTLTLNADGSFDYTPDAGFVGTDSFTYQVSDGNGGFDEAVATIMVAPEPNSAPNAVGDSYSVDAGEVLTIGAAQGVLANDTDPDGDALFSSMSVAAANGTVNLNADGSFDYTPNAGFDGPDTFTYQVDDLNGGTDLATVNITVNAVGGGDFPMPSDYDAVILGDELSNTLRGTGSLNEWIDAMESGDKILAGAGDDYIIAGAGSDNFVLGGAGADIFQFGLGDNTVQIHDWEDGTDLIHLVDGLTFADLTAVQSGTTLSLFADDGGRLMLRNTTAAQIDEADFLTGGGTPPPVNAAPVANDDAYDVVGGSTLTLDIAGGVLANDTDADGDALTAALVADAGNGSLTLNANGSFDYTPDAGFVGEDTFVYNTSDGTDTSGNATVTITVEEEPVVGGGDPMPSDYDAVILGDNASNTLRGTGSLNEWIDAMGAGDKILAGAGDDYIIAGSGSDNFVLGGTGADIFQFGLGDNNIKIHDWEDGVDLINLVDELTFADLTVIEAATSVSLFTTGGDRLILQNVTAAQIDENDFFA